MAVSEDGALTWEQVIVAPDVSMENNQSAVALDHGKTWGAPQVIAPPGVHEGNYPTLAAGAAGRIVVTFPGTTSTDEEDVSRP